MLERLIDRAAHIVAIHPDEAVIVAHHFGDDVAGAERWAHEWNAAGFNVYWTVNVTTAGKHRKPSKTDIVEVRFAHVDIDPPMDKNAKLCELLTAPVPPSAVIDSGNGLQALWRLRDSPTSTEIEALNRRLAKTFGGDSCHNVDRLLRVPGTVNYPNALKRERGYERTVAGILVC